MSCDEVRQWIDTHDYVADVDALRAAVRDACEDVTYWNGTGLTAGSFAAGAIDAGTIAAVALGATEIAGASLDEGAAQTQGTFTVVAEGYGTAPVAHEGGLSMPVVIGTMVAVVLGAVLVSWVVRVVRWVLR